MLLISSSITKFSKKCCEITRGKSGKKRTRISMLNDTCKLICSVISHHDFVSSFSTTTKTTNIFHFFLLLLFLFPFLPSLSSLRWWSYSLPSPDFHIHHSRPEQKNVDNLVDKMFRKSKSSENCSSELVKASKMICFHDSFLFNFTWRRIKEPKKTFLFLRKE